MVPRFTYKNKVLLHVLEVHMGVTAYILQMMLEIICENIHTRDLKNSIITSTDDDSKPHFFLCPQCEYPYDNISQHTVYRSVLNNSKNIKNHSSFSTTRQIFLDLHIPRHSLWNNKEGKKKILENTGRNWPWAERQEDTGNISNIINDSLYTALQLKVTK